MKKYFDAVNLNKDVETIIFILPLVVGTQEILQTFLVQETYIIVFFTYFCI